MNSTFKCLNCGQLVSAGGQIGTAHRNHCPFCLWSKHVDNLEGDRESQCRKSMEPIGLTFKKEKPDKYHPAEKGELMLVHRCLADDKISINRLAADDNPREVLKILENSKKLSGKFKSELEAGGILLANEDDMMEINKQLHGEKF